MCREVFSRSKGIATYSDELSKISYINVVESVVEKGREDVDRVRGKGSIKAKPAQIS
jgi:hypothetical protein